MDRLLTVEEVANIFQIDVTTVYKMVQEGKLQKVELGIKKYRFNADYIKSLCQADNSQKTWREITLEKEIDRLKKETQDLREQAAELNLIATKMLRRG